MEAIRERLQNPVVAIVTGLVVGLLLGLWLGWGVWPVQWYDLDASTLRADIKVDYMNLTVRDFARTMDVEKAKARWQNFNGMGGTSKAAFDALRKAPGDLTEDELSRFEQAVTGAVNVPGQAEPGTERPAASSGGSLLMTLLQVLCVLVLLFGIGFGTLYFLRQRGANSKTRPMTSVERAQQAAAQVERTDYTQRGETTPTAQFVTTYMLGDDLFDDSFSIDSASGEFLGECGVGISDTIGVGDPKRVTAFEVWLFDKNDIQTVTKVVMSRHAFYDDAIRQRLAAKGEPTQAKPQSEVVLETATLRLIARVVDLAYGEGPLPPESFFERFTLELAIWQKEE
ncbi:MAG: hypothetical protein OHK0052_19390 [Anaerolineales bacterium]